VQHHQVDTVLVEIPKDAFDKGSHRPKLKALPTKRLRKATLTAGGKLREKVFDVAWSGDRKPGEGGQLPPVGSTVDVEDASYTNRIGSPELSAVWRDPQFDPDQHAFYYVRAIEIPTPRWTAYDAKYHAIADPDKAIPMVIQERVYSSPIWYTAEDTRESQ